MMLGPLTMLAAAMVSAAFDRPADWVIYGSYGDKLPLAPAVTRDATCPGTGNVLVFGIGRSEVGMNYRTREGGFVIRPKTRYEISCRAKADRPGVFRLGFDLWRRGYRHYYRHEGMPVGTDWQEYRLRLTTPSTNEYPVLALGKGQGFVAVNGRDGIEKLYLADWRARELPPETVERFPVARTDGSDIYPPAAGYPPPPLSPTLTPGGPGNRIVNSSFELGDAAWGTVEEVSYADMAHGAPRADVKAVGGDTVHGKSVLSVDTVAAGRAVKVCAASVPLSTCPTTVTFSVWAKASKPCRVTLGFENIGYNYRLGGGDWSDVHEERDVGTTWKRISQTWRTLARTKRLSPYVRVPAGVLVKLDAVQLEEGEKPSAYAPAAPVEAAYVIRGLPLFEQKAGECRERTAAFLTVDYATGEAKSRPERFTTSAFGSFALTGRHAGRAAFPAEYAVVPQPKPGSGGFFLGVNGTTLSRSHVMTGGVRIGKGETYEDVFRRLRLSGIGFLRLWDVGFDWRDVEPEKGKYDWTIPDFIVNGLLRAGIEPMWVLGGNGAMLRYDGEREAKYRDWFVRKNSRTGGKPIMVGTYPMLPDDGDWTDFLRALANRYRGKIRHYEVMNEPNLYISDGATYVRYLKLTHDTLRAVDPAAKIVGVCATGDFGGRIGEYVDSIGRAGGFGYFDIMSFHPYSAPSDLTLLDASEQMAGIRALVDKYAPGMPILEDELYYLADRRVMQERALPRDYAPGMLPRRHALDLAAGCIGSVPLHATSLQDGDMIRPGVGWGMEFYAARWFPSPLVVVESVAAQFLSGATFRSQLKLPHGLNGFVFADSQGGEFAMLWAKEAKYACSADLGDMVAVDVFGNPVKEGLRRIGVNPLYLRGHDLARRLSAAKYAFESGADVRNLVSLELMP